MVSYKITFLAAALVAMVPFAAADLDSLVSINLKRGEDANMAMRSTSNSDDLLPHARKSQFNPDTYEDGKYKTNWTACKTQLSKTKSSMNVTHLESDGDLVAHNVPAVCMTLGHALSNHFSEANPLPMGDNVIKIANVTQATVDNVHTAFGKHFHKSGGSTAAANATKATKGDE